MTRLLARSSGAMLLFLPAAFALSADAVDSTIDQVTITATRLTPTAPGVAAARAEAARVPGGASVVEADEYAARRASNLLDVLAFTPGVYIQPRFGAEEARLSIRGSGLQRTFHMRGIQLLQDGVPITLADGGGDFQAIEPLALAYTEILRGANALQYGGTTLGGSINFVSPSGHDGAGLHARLEGGSHDYLRAYASAGGEGERIDAFGSLSAYRQDGFRAWSEQRNVRFSANAGLELVEGVGTRLYVTAVNSESQLPGSLTKAQLADSPQLANAGSLAGRQRRDFDLYRLANRTSLTLGETRVLDMTLGYTRKDLSHPIFQVLEQRSDDYSAGARLVDDSEWFGRGNRFVLGVSGAWNSVDDDRYVNVAGHPGARTAQSRQHARNASVYIQDELDVTERWTFVAGAQWTDSGRRYRDRFLANGDQGFDESWHRFSPKLGFIWNPSADWSIFGNVSDAFEPPSFGELAGGPGVDVLEAQRARTVEVGTRGALASVSWDVVLYTSDVRDELLGLSSPTGDPLGTVNAPRTVHRGVELGVAGELMEALSWRVNGLYSDFHFDGHPVYGDGALPGIAEQLYRAELEWSPVPGYFVSLNGEWSPRRYAVDMAHSWFADSYALWGLRIGHTAEQGLSWFVEGRNLGDRHYAASTGVIADARGADTAQFLPGDGRSVYAGISWKIDER